MGIDTFRDYQLNPEEFRIRKALSRAISQANSENYSPYATRNSQSKADMAMGKLRGDRRLTLEELNRHILY